MDTSTVSPSHLLCFVAGAAVTYFLTKNSNHQQIARKKYVDEYIFLFANVTLYSFFCNCIFFLKKKSRTHSNIFVFFASSTFFTSLFPSL